MSDLDDLRSWLFRSLMFEAEAESFREAGVQVGVDQGKAEDNLLAESLAPFPLQLRNEALRMARLYAILYCFENSIRELIKSRLLEQDEKWWTGSRVPASVRRTAESRQADASENSWLEGVNKDILGFVDFSGLSSIILQNWAEFEDLIPSQHWLKQRMDELERARNFVAHNRMLLEAEFGRLEMYVSDWNKQVGL